MNPPDFFQKPPSRLTLGTVQFGLVYGVANRTGRPSFETVREIIRRASEGGVDVLDTAPTYGESEERIGRILGDLGLRNRMRVVTKIEALPPDLPSAEAARAIEATVVQSLKRLGLEQIPLCLFHREENIRYAPELLALRDRGLIAAGGVSLVNPEAARRALTFPELTVWQIATNLLDRRYTHTGLTAAAKARGIGVFTRSVYLQGLLLMDEALVPPHLRDALPPRRRLEEMARRFDLSFAEVAIRAIATRPDVWSVVVGVETVAQIEENIALLAKGPLPAELYAAIQEFEPGLSDSILMPNHWNEAAQKLALERSG